MEYDREKAVAYAHKWAFTRNLKYYDFEKLGGDCTNFVSQCVYAGCGRMNRAKTAGWYYKNLNDRAPAWTGVGFFYSFLTGNTGDGPYGHETDMSGAMEGDAAQLCFDGGEFTHTLIIVKINDLSPGGILVAAHSYDADRRPLGTYAYSGYRLIHIDSVR